MNTIEVRDVEKKFKVYFDKGQTLKERLLFQKRNHYDERRVLNGITFQVSKGEAIGLIGENGSGKSTLLKLLTKIIYPEIGSIAIAGRVSSLIELGAGFHPDMSGRENIYTNASIFGLNKKEIDKRLDSIIEFSELEQFIDNPVRTYSSGMYMRLAFSVAINVDADVLLIDEILAVGDASFQTKCFNRLREIKAKGTTIVIVSHSLGQIEQICERSLWICNGQIRLEGKPCDVHPQYMEYMGLKSKKSSEESLQKVSVEPRKEKETAEEKIKEIEIQNIQLFDGTRQEKAVYRTGEEMNILIHYKLNKEIVNPVVGIRIYRNDGNLYYATNTNNDGKDITKLSESGKIEFSITKLNLLEGEYVCEIVINNFDGYTIERKKNVGAFRIYSTIAERGLLSLEHEWNMD